MSFCSNPRTGRAKQVENQCECLASLDAQVLLFFPWNAIKGALPLWPSPPQEPENQMACFLLASLQNPPNGSASLRQTDRSTDPPIHRSGQGSPRFFFRQVRGSSGLHHCQPLLPEGEREGQSRGLGVWGSRGLTQGAAPEVILFKSWSLRMEVV